MRFALGATIGLLLVSLLVSRLLHTVLPPEQAETFSLGVLLLSSVIVFVDLFDFLLRLRRQRIQSPAQRRRPVAHLDADRDRAVDPLISAGCTCVRMRSRSRCTSSGAPRRSSSRRWRRTARACS
jgi:hypothetical protein